MTHQDTAQVLRDLQALHQEYATKLSMVATEMVNLSSASVGSDENHLKVTLHRIRSRVLKNCSPGTCTGPAESHDDEIKSLWSTIESLKLEKRNHKNTHHCMQRVSLIWI